MTSCLEMLYSSRSFLLRVTKYESYLIFVFFQDYVFQIRNYLPCLNKTWKEEKYPLILSENSDYEPFILSLSQTTGASVLKISQQREPLRLRRNMQGQRVDCSWQRLSPAFVSKGMLWRRWSEAGTQMWLMASWQILRTGAQPDHKGAPPTSIIAHHKNFIENILWSMFYVCKVQSVFIYWTASNIKCTIYITGKLSV